MYQVALKPAKASKA